VNVANASPVADWSTAEIWDVFLALVDRESPLPGLATALAPYRAAFEAVVGQIRVEHRCFANRYYRTEDRRPIVNPTNIEHLTRLLHYFSQELAAKGAPELVLDCLFYVLKGRCHINLFYRQRIPGFFFALHAIGAVLGYGSYGRFLIVHQGATVGESHGRYPTLGDAVVIGPHAMVLGDSRIGDNVWIGAGALVIDRAVPANSIVVGRPPNLEIRPNPNDNRKIWFDLDMIAA
jgi:serine O-acetyltransferase